jgi:hypothetical protein
VFVRRRGSSVRARYGATDGWRAVASVASLECWTSPLFSVAWLLHALVELTRIVSGRTKCSLPAGSVGRSVTARMSFARSVAFSSPASRPVSDVRLVRCTCNEYDVSRTSSIVLVHQWSPTQQIATGRLTCRGSDLGRVCLAWLNFSWTNLSSLTTNYKY